MPHIATKINCDGDKCYNCLFMHGDCSIYEDGTTARVCKLFRKYTKDGNRLPECLAAELVKQCQTCGHKQDVEFCDIRKITGNSEAYHFDCWDNNLKYWKPATKGKR